MTWPCFIWIFLPGHYIFVVYWVPVHLALYILYVSLVEVIRLRSRGILSLVLKGRLLVLSGLPLFNSVTASLLIN